LPPALMKPAAGQDRALHHLLTSIRSERTSQAEGQPLHPTRRRSKSRSAPRRGQGASRGSPPAKAKDPVRRLGAPLPCFVSYLKPASGTSAPDSQPGEKPKRIALRPSGSTWQLMVSTNRETRLAADPIRILIRDCEFRFTVFLLVPARSMSSHRFPRRLQRRLGQLDRQCSVFRQLRRCRVSDVQ
jgi:hypothetical protein